MSVKTVRILDPQGRIVLPNHIREALKLVPGNVVEVDLDEEGSIRIRATQRRCSVCGQSVEGTHSATIKAGKAEKYICYECTQKILKNIMK